MRLREPRCLSAGTVRGVAVGPRGSVPVSSSGTSTVGTDEVRGHCGFLPGSMFLGPALGPIEYLSLPGVGQRLMGWFSQGGCSVKGEKALWMQNMPTIFKKHTEMVGIFADVCV